MPVSINKKNKNKNKKIPSTVTQSPSMTSPTTTSVLQVPNTQSVNTTSVQTPPSVPNITSAINLLPPNLQQEVQVLEALKQSAMQGVKPGQHISYDFEKSDTQILPDPLRDQYFKDVVYPAFQKWVENINTGQQLTRDINYQVDKWRSILRGTDPSSSALQETYGTNSPFAYSIGGGLSLLPSPVMPPKFEQPPNLYKEPTTGTTKQKYGVNYGEQLENKGGGGGGGGSRKKKDPLEVRILDGSMKKLGQEIADDLYNPNSKVNLTYTPTEFKKANLNAARRITNGMDVDNIERFVDGGINQQLKMKFGDADISIDLSRLNKNETPGLAIVRTTLEELNKKNSNKLRKIKEIVNYKNNSNIHDAIYGFFAKNDNSEQTNIKKQQLASELVTVIGDIATQLIQDNPDKFATLIQRATKTNNTYDLGSVWIDGKDLAKYVLRLILAGGYFGDGLPQNLATPKATGNNNSDNE